MKFILILSLFLSGGIKTLERSYPFEELKELKLDLGIGFGKLYIEKAERGKLAEVFIKYPEEFEDSLKVDFERNERMGELTIKFKVKETDLKKLKEKPVEMRISLPTRIPLSIDLGMGLSEGDIDLGGFRIRNLDIKVGLGKLVIDFTERNGTDMEKFSIETGAARLKIKNLGNARADRIEVESGLGSLTFYLDGEWSRDCTIDVKGALLLLDFEIPEDIGLFIETKGALNLKAFENMVEAEGGYISENYSSAKQKVAVIIEGSLNHIKMDWIK
jgi:hypothetical protein